MWDEIRSIENQIGELDSIDSSKLYQLYQATIKILEKMQNFDVTLEELCIHKADRLMRTMFFLDIDFDQAMDSIGSKKQ